ncbi:hypothetical protein DPSP01_011781 [Paraphaeosphaeria sporulosa]|uniref:Uncharacterized protein n=1 Tax=Paraphaeosphaeria sporulosa TaxID=1460663 RepID=A0A177CG70_9PLEO|nr:uncharacterized protein CC84DRAFT_1146375 [Paraphaeosphaeria sporulosa]OAG06346.1 hypothetical protein CC84DRAFT_1146375 [Paraphaeosphaeria sporulosa]
MAAIDVPRDPTEEEALALFEVIEEKFPSTTIGDDKWYVLTFAAMVAGGGHEFAPLLYKELIKRPEYKTSEQRQALMRRIRETLLKLVSVAGVCKPLDAIFDIDAITAPEDKDYSFSREGWQCDEENRKRGFAWQDRLYRHNQGAIDNALSSQKDFDWISKNISYGLYLSDHTILNDVETELTVLGGIMIQNLPRETGWHLRGTRRIGVSKEDVETIQQCIELIGKFCGLKLHKVPRVADIEHEV